MAGAFLDPLADKLLISRGARVRWWRPARWPPGSAMVIIAREFAVTGLRLVAAAENVIISAGRFGKAKALSQNVALGADHLPGRRATSCATTFLRHRPGADGAERRPLLPGGPLAASSRARRCRTPTRSASRERGARGRRSPTCWARSRSPIWPAARRASTCARWAAATWARPTSSAPWGASMGIAVMAGRHRQGRRWPWCIARALTDDPWPAIAAGAAMAGHVFPVWLRFKGGKGVAVGGGARHRADAAGRRRSCSALWPDRGRGHPLHVAGEHDGRGRRDAAGAGRWATRSPTSCSRPSRRSRCSCLHRGNIVRLLARQENRGSTSGDARRPPEPRAPGVDRSARSAFSAFHAG